MNRSVWYTIGKCAGILLLAIGWFICGMNYANSNNHPKNLAVWCDEHNQTVYLMTRDGNVYTHDYYFER